MTDMDQPSPNTSLLILTLFLFLLELVVSDEYCPRYRISSTNKYKEGFWCRGHGVYCCGSTSNHYCCCDCTRSFAKSNRLFCDSKRKEDPSCQTNLSGTIAGVVGGVVASLAVFLFFLIVCCKKNRPHGGFVLSRRSSAVIPLRSKISVLPHNDMAPPTYSLHPPRQPVTPPPPYRSRPPTGSISPPPPYTTYGNDPAYPPVENPLPRTPELRRFSTTGNGRQT